MSQIALREDRGMSYKSRSEAFFQFIDERMEKYVTPFDANEIDCPYSIEVMLKVYQEFFEETGQIPDSEDISMAISEHNATIVYEVAKYDYHLNDSELGYSSYIEEDTEEEEAIMYLVENWWEDIDAGNNHFNFFFEIANFYDSRGLAFVDNYGQDVYASRGSTWGPDPRVVNCYDLVVGDAQNVLIPEIHVAGLASGSFYRDEMNDYLRIKAYGKERVR